MPHAQNPRLKTSSLASVALTNKQELTTDQCAAGTKAHLPTRKALHVRLATARCKASFSHGRRQIQGKPVHSKRLIGISLPLSSPYTLFSHQTPATVNVAHAPAQNTCDTSFGCKEPSSARAFRRESISMVVPYSDSSFSQCLLAT